MNKREYAAVDAGALSLAEELRDGLRQLLIRAAEQGDTLAAAVARAHHRRANQLVITLGGASVM